MSRSFVAAVPTCLRRVADIAFKISIYLQKSMMLIDSWGTSPATTRQRFFFCLPSVIEQLDFKQGRLLDPGCKLIHQ